MIPLAEAGFWLSAALLVYVFAGFGVLVGLAGTLSRARVRKRDVTPRVTLLIAAYNEEKGIEAKIRNSLALDYPQDALEILVGSDGSTDRTGEIVARFADRVTFLALPRRGKIFVLDELVSRATGEVLVFSDANTLYEPDALRKLVRNFADPDVGGVCGNQKHLKCATGADSSGSGEGLYWKYDKWLKAMESATGSIVSADGAMYAIRRELYPSPQSAAVTDDFWISTGVVDRGKRLVFEKEAVGWEPTTGKASREFSRKVRIMNRGLNGVLLRRRLLNPFRYGFYSVVLFSHKVLRRLASAFLLSLFVTSLVLASRGGFFALAALGQALFYGLALAGWALRRTGPGRHRLLSTPFFFCLANAAALVAVLNLARGRRVERWEPSRETATGEVLRDAVPAAGEHRPTPAPAAGSGPGPAGSPEETAEEPLGA